MRAGRSPRPPAASPPASVPSEAVEHGTETELHPALVRPGRGIAGVHAVGGVAQAGKCRPSICPVEEIAVLVREPERSRRGEQGRVLRRGDQRLPVDELHVEIRGELDVRGVDGGIAEPEAASGRGPQDAGDHDRDGTLLELREVTDVGLLAVGLQDKPVADLQLQLVCGRLRERDLEGRHLGCACPLGDVRGDGAYPCARRAWQPAGDDGSRDSTPAAGTRRFR